MTDLSILERAVGADRALTLALNGSNQGGGDAFWCFLSSNAATIPAYVLAIALILWSSGWKRGLFYVLAIALALAASDQICNLVKEGVGRLRPSFDPYMLENGVRVLLKSSPKHCYGFYSAHSALSFALAFASSVAIRWGVNGRAADGGRRRLFRALSVVYAIAVFVWAALVALSRVFVAKHFVGDIVAGCLAGIFMAYIWLYAARFAADRFRSRKETSK